MQYERRKAKRVTVNLKAFWEGVLERREATVTSLSVTGCFILSGGEVSAKELVRVEIHLSDGPIFAWAEVVDHAYEIGFAARFTALEDDDQDRLNRFVANIADHQI